MVVDALRGSSAPCRFKAATVTVAIHALAVTADAAVVHEAIALAAAGRAWAAR